MLIRSLRVQKKALLHSHVKDEAWKNDRGVIESNLKKAQDDYKQIK